MILDLAGLRFRGGFLQSRAGRDVDTLTAGSNPTVVYSKDASMRVLIVDDHEVVRRGVRSLLRNQSNIAVCGEAADGQEAIEKAQLLRPDVIIMDVSMPAMNGLDATRQVRESLPECEVLILSQHQSAEMVRLALSAGAKGYVVKSSVARDLLKALSKLRVHELFFDPEVSGVVNPSSPVDAQEILERSAALERALRESEELYRTTFELAGVGVAHVNADGRLLRVNPKFCDIVGYTREELTALTFQQITHPDDLVADVAQAEKIVAGTSQQYFMEKRYIRKDGSTVWVNLTVSPVRDHEGRLKHFISVVEDISERKRVEQNLRESESRFRTMADTAPVLIWTSGTDARCDFFNRWWLEFTGRTTEQELGNGWAEGVHSEDYDRCLRVYLSSFQARQPFSMEYRLRRYDGEYRWILDNGVPRTTPDGQFAGYIGSCIDITDRKRTEAAQGNCESALMSS